MLILKIVCILHKEAGESVKQMNQKNDGRENASLKNANLLLEL